MAERLRAYVRERVKPGERHYKRGVAAELAAHLRNAGLGEDAAWISAYADPDAKPRRNADVDTALAICDFFGVTLADFQDGGPSLSRAGSTVATSTKGGRSDVPASAQRAHLREITALKLRIVRYETALRKVRDGARQLARTATIGSQSRKASGGRS